LHIQKCTNKISYTDALRVFNHKPQNYIDVYLFNLKFNFKMKRYRHTSILKPTSQNFLKSGKTGFCLHFFGNNQLITFHKHTHTYSYENA